MAVYATIADLAVFGVDAAALASIPDANKTAALTAASAKVDSYLRNRFSLPLTEWGVEIKEATAIIASYNLLITRGLSPDGAKSLTNRYEHTISWLKDVQNGDATPSGLDATGQAQRAVNAGPFVVQASVSSVAREGAFWTRDSDDGEVVVSVGTPTLRGV